MKEYDIQQKGNNEIIISFMFDKTSTVASLLFSIVLIGIIFFKINYSVLLDIWGYIIILIILLCYLTFNKYFEWNKNKYHKLVIIDDDDLIINDILRLKLRQIKSVNISYNVNQFESGWTIYLQKYLGSEDYIIKKRLKEKDAHSIAEKVAAFLNKELVID